MRHSPCLREVGVLKRHGVDEDENELGIDFTPLEVPKLDISDVEVLPLRARVMPLCAHASRGETTSLDSP